MTEHHPLELSLGCNIFRRAQISILCGIRHRDSVADSRVYCYLSYNLISAVKLLLSDDGIESLLFSQILVRNVRIEHDLDSSDQLVSMLVDCHRELVSTTVAARVPVKSVFRSAFFVFKLNTVLLCSQ